MSAGTPGAQQRQRDANGAGLMQAGRKYLVQRGAMCQNLRPGAVAVSGLAPPLWLPQNLQQLAPMQYVLALCEIGADYELLNAASDDICLARNL